jgi:hypothetical protein
MTGNEGTVQHFTKRWNARARARARARRRAREKDIASTGVIFSSVEMLSTFIRQKPFFSP